MPLVFLPDMAGTESWLAGAKDVIVGILLAMVILALVLGGLFLYSNTWPPLSVVESQSMQHDAYTSYIGVIDTGDMVVIRESNGLDVVTYVEGAQTGYSRFGGFGDVIIFMPSGDDTVTPIIHRAIIWLDKNTSGGWDAPSLEDYQGNWAVSSGDGWRGMTGTLILHGIGYANVSVIIELDDMNPHSGYVTMGDFNWRYVPGPVPRIGLIDQSEHGRSAYDLVSTDWVKSKAMVEIPWLGSIKLLITQGNDAAGIPLNSIINLGISVFVVLAVPLLAEYAWDKRRERKGGRQ